MDKARKVWVGGMVGGIDIVFGGGGAVDFDGDDAELLLVLVLSLDVDDDCFFDLCCF